MTDVGSTNASGSSGLGCTSSTSQSGRGFSFFLDANLSLRRVERLTMIERSRRFRCVSMRVGCREVEAVGSRKRGGWKTNSIVSRAVLALVLVSMAWSDYVKYTPEVPRRLVQYSSLHTDR